MKPSLPPSAGFYKGLRDGFPICLGYLSVSFAFGIAVVGAGLPAWTAVLISMTNVTSAGQLAGLTVIAGGGSLIEMALTQLVINLRYALMSFSLTQKLSPRFHLPSRLAVSFMVTDEIFAVAASQPGEVSRRYMLGLSLAPYLGWAGGTLVGAVAGGVLPSSVVSALGVAIYGMFIAIVIPAAKRFKNVLGVAGAAVVVSCLFHFTPGLCRLSDGFIIIISAVAASLFGALLWPMREAKGDAPQ